MNQRNRIQTLEARVIELKALNVELNRQLRAAIANTERSIENTNKALMGWAQCLHTLAEKSQGGR